MPRCCVRCDSKPGKEVPCSSRRLTPCRGSCITTYVRGEGCSFFFSPSIFNLKECSTLARPTCFHSIFVKPFRKFLFLPIVVSLLLKWIDSFRLIKLKKYGTWDFHIRIYLFYIARISNYISTRRRYFQWMDERPVKSGEFCPLKRFSIYLDTTFDCRDIVV